MRRSHKRKVAIGFGLVFAASLGIATGYIHLPHAAYYASVLVSWMKTNLTTFRTVVIFTFGGSLLSIPVLRKRAHRQKEMEPISVHSLRQNKSHPLANIPRPARDTKFVIRKTKKRGRISRNRDGQRLPPSRRD